MSAHIAATDVAWGPDGLVPAIVQDAADGRVLMLAYVDAEALEATYATGDVHFHSRKRNRLWKKGEESGNVLRFVDVAGDCDSDSLLFTANPVGPTCHSGTRSCFDPHGEPAAEAEVPAGRTAGATPLPCQGFGWLETLWATIDERAGADPAESYTARLVAKGVDGAARKVAEEATEVLMAAKDDAVAAPEARAATQDALTGEVADLLYHTLVVLRERGLPPSSVIERLRERHRA
jgi:phosphoribosyl-AMP cyclohydrolase / phosphoribosyl-ATP pyrophosphohydrolase